MGTNLRNHREFEQRFLDRSERSHLREEAASVGKGRFDSLKKRYAMMVLGATLAMGGLGIPLKMKQTPQAELPQAKSSSVVQLLRADLQTAQNIAREVTGGVEEAAKTLSTPLEPLQTVEKDLQMITEKAKEEFFRKEIPFGSLIYAEAKRNDLKPELVAAVVKTESRFKPNARSPVGAQGLMQLVPRTGRWMGAKNLMDPTQNIKAGTKYLKYLNERFDGNETKMIAAYNAGEGNVRRFQGVPPFKETRNYVTRVRNSASEYEDMIASHIAESSMAEEAVVEPALR